MQQNVCLILREAPNDVFIRKIGWGGSLQQHLTCFEIQDLDVMLESIVVKKS